MEPRTSGTGVGSDSLCLARWVLAGPGLCQRSRRLSQRAQCGILPPLLANNRLGVRAGFSAAWSGEGGQLPRKLEREVGQGPRALPSQHWSPCHSVLAGGGGGGLSCPLGLHGTLVGDGTLATRDHRASCDWSQKSPLRTTRLFQRIRVPACRGERSLVSPTPPPVTGLAPSLSSIMTTNFYTRQEVLALRCLPPT